MSSSRPQSQAQLRKEVWLCCSLKAALSGIPPTIATRRRTCPASPACGRLCLCRRSKAPWACGLWSDGCGHVGVAFRDFHVRRRHRADPSQAQVPVLRVCGGCFAREFGVPRVLVVFGSAIVAPFCHWCCFDRHPVAKVLLFTTQCIGEL